MTFNHDGRTYELGTGYGHIAIGVDDLDATLERLKAQGIEPEREPYRVREGGSLLCFVRDPTATGSRSSAAGPLELLREVVEREVLHRGGRGRVRLVAERRPRLRLQGLVPFALDARDL